YCIAANAPEARLSNFERLTLTGGRELERALAWAAQHMVDAHLFQDIGEVRPAAIAEAHAFYSTATRSQDAIFPLPPVPGSVRETIIHGLQDGEVVDLSFQSSYEPLHPRVRALWANTQENQEVHLRWWRHRKRPHAV